MIGLVKKIYVQPFSHKPSTEEEALGAVQCAQDRYDQAVRTEQENMYKPGNQKRDNNIKSTRSALEEAKADLEHIINPKQLSLFL